MLKMFQHSCTITLHTFTYCYKYQSREGDDEDNDNGSNNPNDQFYHASFTGQHLCVYLLVESDVTHCIRKIKMCIYRRARAGLPTPKNLRKLIQ